MSVAVRYMCPPSSGPQLIRLSPSCARKPPLPLNLMSPESPSFPGQLFNPAARLPNRTSPICISYTDTPHARREVQRAAPEVHGRVLAEPQLQLCAPRDDAAGSDSVRRDLPAAREGARLGSLNPKPYGKEGREGGGVAG
eukprot:69689-Chlamydomonas_euryale.AAC.2